MYVSQLSTKAQSLIKARLFTNLLNEDIHINEIDIIISNAMDSKLYDLSEHLTNKELKQLIPI